MVLWGTTEQNDRVLIAMELRAEENKVQTWLFPEAIASPEFSQKMLNDWRNGATVAFPEGFTHSERELNLTESLMPAGITVERGDFIQRAQSEWQFIVLSTKLNQAYKSELAELQDKIGQMTEFSGEVFGALKGFWGKVNNQVKDRNLFREHADELRDTTNELFEQLKGMRTAVMNEYEDNSKKWFEQLNATLDDVEQRIESGIQRFPELFDKLKHTQAQFRDQKLTRDHSNELWGRIDLLFKTLKEKRFGNDATNEGNPTDRMAKRLEGLIAAVDKMQVSIDRDREELNFQKKRVASSEGQLEAQIRQAKINMILERVKSKEEKLAEMLATKQDVESKMVSFRAKEDRRVAEEAKKVADAAVRKAEAEQAAAVVAEVETAPAPIVEAVPVVASVTTTTVSEVSTLSTPIVRTVVSEVRTTTAPTVTTTVTTSVAPTVTRIVTAQPTETVVVDAGVSTPSVSEVIAEIKAENGLSDIAADADAALKAAEALA
ncbi:MAG: hypothetical protein U5L45_18895 [Saprospiraceae bacterium]|nr:hypothetical protein [Saprospiraceae bacterium]